MSTGNSQGSKAQRSRRPTIADVARLANVSQMTVSNVVNRRFGSMGQQTRETVEKAIAELGYRPHASGRSLKLSKRFSIGMVVVDESPTFLADPFITNLVAGLSNHLNQRDYGLVVQGMRADHLPEAALIRRHETDALCVFLSGERAKRAQMISDFAGLGQPVVVMQEAVPKGSGLYSVRQDDRAGSAELALHLHARGARHVLFLAPDVAWPAIEERIEGARTVLLARECRFSVVQCGDGGFDATRTALAAAVAAGGWPPAIMGGNDQMGIAALKWCADQGRTAPSDILVSGFNAFETWRYSTPSLTTVVSPAYELGETAGGILLSVLQGEPVRRREHVLPVRLKIGGSTDV
ncbi:MAG: LacI family DNA-binding transcriptional regulator [Rhizobiaceae bacterium]|nr:LacI family DNA-binding transcriptional regulator [Rhizobiaceae bacterium]